MNYINFFLLILIPGIAYAENGKSVVGAFLIFLVILWIVFFGSTDSKITLIKTISIILFIIGYIYFLIKLGHFFQLKYTPEKENGFVSFLIFIVGWFGPLVIYAKSNSKSSN
jgi:Mn2+/Fe2+ NRAMP family transporter